jgi:hypothetical protein
MFPSYLSSGNILQMHRRSFIDASQKEVDDSSSISVLILRLLLDSSTCVSVDRDYRDVNLLGTKCHKRTRLCWCGSDPKFESTSNDEKTRYNSLLTKLSAKLTCSYELDPNLTAMALLELNNMLPVCRYRRCGETPILNILLELITSNGRMVANDLCV